MAQVTFRADVANAANCDISAEFTNVSTDLATMEAYLDVKDQYDNLRGATYSDTVVFSLDGETFNATLVGNQYVADVDIPNVDGDYTLAATVNGNAVTGITITVAAGEADLDNSTIQPIASQTADVATVLIAVEIQDGDNNVDETGSETVTITLNGVTQTAVFNATTDKYEYTFSNPNTATTYTVTATVGGQALNNSVNYVVTPGVPTAAQSVLTPNPTTLVVGNPTTLTVQLKDQYSNNLSDNGGVTDILFAADPDNITFAGSATMNGDGTATSTGQTTTADVYDITIDSLVF